MFSACTSIDAQAVGFATVHAEVNGLSVSLIVANAFMQSRHARVWDGDDRYRIGRIS